AHMIGCSICKSFYHNKCINIPHSKAIIPFWACPDCVSWLSVAVKNKDTATVNATMDHDPANVDAQLAKDLRDQLECLHLSFSKMQDNYVKLFGTVIELVSDCSDL